MEVARRRLYQEAAENIVKGMINQLEAMTEGPPSPVFSKVTNAVFLSLTLIEESQLRANFNAENGSHLPADICLCIENPPTKWEVVPFDGEALEVLPDIDQDMVTEVSRCGHFCQMCAHLENVVEGEASD